MVQRFADIPQTTLRVAYEEVDKAIRSIAGDYGRNILIGTEHTDLVSAVLADVVDIVPIVGDIANVLRVQDAALRGEEFRRARLPTQVVDLLVGVVPGPLGMALDALTPTNIIGYLGRR